MYSFGPDEIRMIHEQRIKDLQNDYNSSAITDLTKKIGKLASKLFKRNDA